MNRGIELDGALPLRGRSEDLRKEEDNVGALEWKNGAGKYFVAILALAIIINIVRCA